MDGAQQDCDAEAGEVTKQCKKGIRRDLLWQGFGTGVKIQRESLRCLSWGAWQAVPTGIGVTKGRSAVAGIGNINGYPR